MLDKIDIRIPGIIKAKPGATNKTAQTQCQDQTSIAQKNAPMVIGRVNRIINVKNIMIVAKIDPK